MDLNLSYSKKRSGPRGALGESGGEETEEAEPCLPQELRGLLKGAGHSQICRLVLGGPWVRAGGRREGDQWGCRLCLCFRRRAGCGPLMVQGGALGEGRPGEAG